MGLRSAHAEKRKRPVAVTLVALLALALCVYSLTVGVLAVREGGNEQIVNGAFHIGLGIGALSAAVGAFLMRSWGWAAFMIWAVVGLTNQILRYLFFEDPNYASMAINTFAVLALSPADVQIAFGVRHTGNVQPTRRTRKPVDSH